MEQPNPPTDKDIDRAQKRYLEKKDKYHTQCETYLSEILNKNKYIQFLIHEMGNLGCQVTRNFFKCRECKTPSSGFYDPSLGITICENYATNKSVIEHTILHETIHSYDYCRADIDTKNCVQVACSEIRAVNLSGECKFTRELGRMNFGWINHHQECVKRRVEATMKLQPLCKDKSTDYIEVAWKSCYRDWEPFKHVQ